MVQGDIFLLYPIEQTWSITFQPETVVCLDQGNFLTGNDILAFDVSVDDRKDFAVCEFLFLPCLPFFRRAIFRWLLVVEFGYEGNRFVVMFLQMGMCFQFKKVFFQFKLKGFPFGFCFGAGFLMEF